MLGAFGAHGLQGFVSEQRLAVFKTGVEYQVWHALGLMLIALAHQFFRSTTLKVSAWLMLLGVLIFSGSLYLLVLLDQPKLGMITPVGGSLMIVGWIVFAWSIVKSGSRTA